MPRVKTPDTFADRLKALRASTGLSQSQLAAAAGLSLGAITHLEQGLRQPGLQTAMALARGLGVGVCRLTDRPCRA